MMHLSDKTLTEAQETLGMAVVSAVIETRRDIDRLIGTDQVRHDAVLLATLRELSLATQARIARDEDEFVAMMHDWIGTDDDLRRTYHQTNADLAAKAVELGLR